jgi:hypothetical protein
MTHALGNSITDIYEAPAAEVLLGGAKLEMSLFGRRAGLCRPIGIRIVYGHVVVSQG